MKNIYAKNITNATPTIRSEDVETKFVKEACEALQATDNAFWSHYKSRDYTAGWYNLPVYGKCLLKSFVNGTDMSKIIGADGIPETLVEACKAAGITIDYVDSWTVKVSRVTAIDGWSQYVEEFVKEAKKAVGNTNDLRFCAIMMSSMDWYSIPFVSSRKIFTSSIQPEYYCKFAEKSDAGSVKVNEELVRACNEAGIDVKAISEELLRVTTLERAEMRHNARAKGVILMEDINVLNALPECYREDFIKLDIKLDD